MRSRIAHPARAYHQPWGRMADDTAVVHAAPPYGATVCLITHKHPEERQPTCQASEL